MFAAADPLGHTRTSAPAPKRRVMQMLSAAALAGAVAASPVRANVAAYLTFNVALPQDGGTLGHTWVVASPVEEGPQAGLALSYGLYPQQTSLFDRDTNPPGPRGAIYDDTTTNWDYQITYAVDAIQLRAAQQYIQAQRSSQQSGSLGFDAISANSATFIRNVATTAGLTLPNTTNGFGINDSATLGESLRQIGDGGTFASGTVSANGTALLGASPLDFSHSAVLSRAFVDPAGLAAKIGVPSFQTTLAPVTTGSAFTLLVQGVGLNQSLMAVDWGDGSDIRLPVQQFVLHSYTSPGTYSGRLVVLENGALDTVNFTAIVSSGTDNGLLPVSLANQPDVHVSNPGAASIPFQTIPSHWLRLGTGSWSDATNWISGAVPNGAGAFAYFDDDYGVNVQTQVNVNVPVTLGTMIFFMGSWSYTIGGSNTITFAVPGGQAEILDKAGNHTISAPVVLANDTTISVVESNRSLTIQGSFTATGKTIYKISPGKLVMPALRAGGLNVSGGTVQFTSKATANDPTGTSVVQSLSISGSGVVDLTNNSMVIDYSGSVGSLVGDVRQNLLSGRLTGRNTGQFRVGYADNAALGAGSFGTFAGVAVDSTSILIKATYGGDANLDGRVNVQDLLKLATAWNTNGPWSSGDLDYDGIVGPADLAILASNWQAGAGSPLGPSTDPTFAQMLGAFGLPEPAVPEPSAISLIVALPWFVRRRYRRRELTREAAP